MRRGFGGEIVRTSDGKIEAANLGSDHCAEHERGINERNGQDGLAELFGLNPSAQPGVARRLIHVTPKELLLDTRRHIIAFDPYGVSPGAFREIGSIGSHEQIAGAWDQKSFGVKFAATDQGKADMSDLWAAFGRKDIAILFTNTHGNPFARAGLVLAIASRLPDDMVANLAKMAREDDAL
jgi:hypothetical protein